MATADETAAAAAAAAEGPGPRLVLGLIGGSGLTKSSMIKSLASEEQIVETKFGRVLVRTGELSPSVGIVVVQRHGCNPDCDYSPPHLINFRALMTAFKELGVSAIFAICSVGSMRQHIGMGSLIVPDDFFCPQRMLSTFDDHRAHVIPEVNEVMRREILAALFAAGMRPLDGGVYGNTEGPRFETKAEIRFLAQYAEIVGMTGSHEATIAKELEVPYAMLCAVDNMANGIGPPLTVEAFQAEQDRNRPRVEEALHLVLKHFRSYPEILRELSSKPSLGIDELAGGTHTASCDVLIHAAYVVTVDKDDTVLANHAVAISGNKIVEILPSEEADAKYGAFSTTTMEIVRRPDGALMPGMINAHTHAPMVFMRGFGDDMKLDEWLTTKIWPVEVRCVSDEFVRDGTRLAAAEFIKGGTTCYSDMYFFSEASAEVIEDVGMRAFVGAVLIEFPSNYSKDAAQYLEKGEELLKRVAASPSGRVRCTVSPHSVYAVSEEHLIEAHALAKKYNVPFHTHLHETEREVADSEAGDRTSQFCHNCDKACRPLKNLMDNGVVDENFVAAHMCFLTDEEIEAVAKAKASVVHCPTSNLKLASGFCPVQKLLAAGVNVAIGTDGASSNNSLDMFAEMKLAAVLAKGVAKDPVAVPAQAALRMATINGAKALHIDDRVGSLEVGKHADLIAVDLSDISSMPTYTVVSHLVYATGRDQVSDVWVDGKRLLRSKQFTTIDAGKMRRIAERWQRVISDADAASDGTY